MTPLPERDVVFNLVWAGEVFPYLRYFVASQLDRCDARFRFVVNGCPPGQVELMEAFAERYPGRIVDILDLAPKRRPLGHGGALDAVMDRSHDGELFCTIDPDIVARGPFLGTFLAELDDGCDAVTSGRGVWAETDVVPEGHPGVNGEYFYSQAGYTFGSPHFAMYRRAAVEAVRERWHVGFGSGGPDLEEPTKARLAEAGHEYWVYDTAKIVNILLQEDGGVLRHLEHPNLLHIGGVTHYFTPWRYVTPEEGGEREPDWKRWDGMADRFEVAQYCAVVLMALDAGEPAPPIPGGVDPRMVDRLELVRSALVDLVGTYGGDAVGER